MDLSPVWKRIARIVCDKREPSRSCELQRRGRENQNEISPFSHHQQQPFGRYALWTSRGEMSNIAAAAAGEKGSPGACSLTHTLDRLNCLHCMGLGDRQRAYTQQKVDYLFFVRIVDCLENWDAKKFKAVKIKIGGLLAFLLVSIIPWVHGKLKKLYWDWETRVWTINWKRYIKNKCFQYSIHL